MLFPRIGAGVLVAATMQGFGFSWFAAHQVAKMRPLQLVRIEEIPTLRRACEQNAKCYLGKVLDDHRCVIEIEISILHLCVKLWSSQCQFNHIMSPACHLTLSAQSSSFWGETKGHVFESDALGFLSLGTSTPCCIGMLDGLTHIPQGHCQAANR
jgi:hypothetical protein